MSNYKVSSRWHKTRLHVMGKEDVYSQWETALLMYGARDKTGTQGHRDSDGEGK